MLKRNERKTVPCLFFGPECISFSLFLSLSLCLSLSLFHLSSLSFFLSPFFSFFLSPSLLHSLSIYLHTARVLSFLSYIYFSHLRTFGDIDKSLKVVHGSQFFKRILLRFILILDIFDTNVRKGGCCSNSCNSFGTFCTFLYIIYKD